MHNIKEYEERLCESRTLFCVNGIKLSFFLQSDISHWPFLDDTFLFCFASLKLTILPKNGKKKLKANGGSVIWIKSINIVHTKNLFDTLGRWENNCINDLTDSFPIHFEIWSRSWWLPFLRGCPGEYCWWVTN